MPRRGSLVILFVSCLALIAGVAPVLTFWPGPLGKGHVLAAGAGSAILAVAAAWLGPFRRRGRVLLAVLPLVPPATSGCWSPTATRHYMLGVLASSGYPPAR